MTWVIGLAQVYEFSGPECPMAGVSERMQMRQMLKKTAPVVSAPMTRWCDLSCLFSPTFWQHNARFAVAEAPAGQFMILLDKTEQLGTGSSLQTCTHEPQCIFLTNAQGYADFK
jgi:hypothetical protein